MERCAKCGKEKLTSFEITAYGEVRCEDCYDDYLMTDRGQVKYFIDIASSNNFNPLDYDADWLGHVVNCWNRYKDELALSARFIKELEENAKRFGIL